MSEQIKNGYKFLIKSTKLIGICYLVAIITSIIFKTNTINHMATLTVGAIFLTLVFGILGFIYGYIVRPKNEEKEADNSYNNLNHEGIKSSEGNDSFDIERIKRQVKLKQLNDKIN